ncbi:MAG: alanine racemase [Clostridiales bacterium]|nr:alanine racemase [Clostridia bacterium]NLD29044.1 alanine racemase [Clostridiales bacterium]MBQ1314286.1 alanine racemase [Clostridia bacterium]MBQ1529438.1 alanine racemase [Clostridia bacterium]MBQ1707372.1 alanine racemase [Clostridia bacterium]
MPLPQRVYAGIHLNNICHNVQWYMDHTGPDTKTMAVIKTDAYGHGAVMVAKALEKIGVDAFAVATVEEGVELREHGVTEPILILGHVFPDMMKAAIDHELTMAVFNEGNAVMLSIVAGTIGKTAHIHLKLDTGMGRIGFVPHEAGSEERKEVLNTIEGIFQLPNLSIDGIFTHFAKADWADKTFMNEQIALFKSTVADLEARGLDLGIRHMCNSAAGLEKDDDFFDMVRVGITVYGLWPSDEVQKDKIDLRPGMSLVSHVSNVKEVGPGFPVGYGSTYVTTKERTVIATVPVGYGDGYPRSLSNKGEVLIAGRRAPIIGRVCMDQFMVDVTDLPGVAQGDEVVLLGSQTWPEEGRGFDDAEAFSDTITMEELGDLSGRFNYEFACDINKRVPRVYID